MTRFGILGVPESFRPRVSVSEFRVAVLVLLPDEPWPSLAEMAAWSSDEYRGVVRWASLEYCYLSDKRVVRDPRPVCMPAQNRSSSPS